MNRLSSEPDRNSKATTLPAPAGDQPTPAPDQTPAPAAGAATHSDAPSTNGLLPATETQPPGAMSPAHRYKKWFVLAGIAVAVAAAGYLLKPMVQTALNTESTDDAYVNGHYTFVAPRVAGQVKTVFVDNNQRVKKGDLLVQLDPEPYQVQVATKKAAVAAAKTDLAAAQFLVRGLRRKPVACDGNFSTRWRM